VMRDIQIGSPDLPDLRSKAQFTLLRQWLKDCDEEHHQSCATMEHADIEADTKVRKIPTRLIEVGDDGSPLVRLYETGSGFDGEWVALSHRWGPNPHFETTTDNLESHREGLVFEDLPATFKDAVEVTRALGCGYLWIDSICIVQKGPKADFNSEAKRMEYVYSGARCVIAATCANGHYEGFLKKREKRRYVGLRTERGPDASFYICDAIDDFQKHVLDGPMNKRGWVLQEHALARRTIFFDDHQVYWECGYGVRCETMNTLRK